MRVLRNEARDRRGLTLIELVVVLVILIALAGLLVPAATGLIARTHTAAGASNIKEVDKIIQTYQTANRRLPSGLDNLLDELGTGLDPNLRTDAFTLATLPIAHRESLEHAGIETVAQRVSNAGSATYFIGDPVDVDDFASAATISDVDVDAIFGAGTAARYEFGVDDLFVALGVGNSSTLIPNWMRDAPVHFSQEYTPDTAYLRYVVILAVYADESPAKLVGVGAIHHDEIEGLRQHMQEFDEIQ